MEKDLMFQLEQAYNDSKALEEQFKIVDRHLSELQAFEINLDDFDKNPGKEMLSPLGKGLFVETEIKEKKLFVDVGAGVFVRKTPEQSKEIIKGQIKRLGEMKLNIQAQIENANHKLQELYLKSEKANSGA